MPSAPGSSVSRLSSPGYLCSCPAKMPRRTAAGREMFRRILGFREYMTVAETDRQRFNEERNIFEKYLPYAMVYDCVDKWAKAFEDMGIQTDTSGWYVSPYPFAALAFSRTSTASPALSPAPSPRRRVAPVAAASVAAASPAVAVVVAASAAGRQVSEPCQSAISRQQTILEPSHQRLAAGFIRQCRNTPANVTPGFSTSLTAQLPACTG